jgi:hypothetical protein
VLFFLVPTLVEAITKFLLAPISFPKVIAVFPVSA